MGNDLYDNTTPLSRIDFSQAFPGLLPGRQIQLNKIALLQASPQEGKKEEGFTRSLPGSS